MKNPYIQYDKYDSSLKQNAPQTTTGKDPVDPSLLQRALQQCQQDHLKYKHLIENAPDAIFVADAETGLIVEANSKAAKLLGIPVDQVIGMHQSQLHPPEEVKKYRAIFQEHIQNKSSKIFEDIYVQRKDGKKIPVQISASVTQLGPQKVVYSIFRDITKQQDLCKQLKASEQQLKAVFESSQDSVVVVDQNYTNLYINQSALDQVNVTPEQGGVGKTTRDGLGHMPDFMNLWIERIDEVFRTEKPMRVQDNVFIGDRQVYSESILSPIRYPGGEMFAVGIVARDITEQKITQERFKQLAQATFEGVIFHENGVFINSNQQFADMFGYSLDEISRLNGLDLFTPESREIVKEKISSENEGPYESVCLRKDGSTFPAEIRARTVHLEGRNARVAAIRDLTEQKKLQQQLADSERLYKDLYRNAKAALYRTRISDGKLIACSTALATLHGYDSVEECLANHFSTNSYVDKDRRKQLLDELQKNKSVKNFQLRLRHTGGTIIWVSVTADIFPEQGYLEGMLTDITATKLLTQTEMKILKIILTGKSNKEIAYGLGRSTRTIEDHRAHIMHKLGVDNVVDLTRKALGYGITPDE